MVMPSIPLVNKFQIHPHILPLLESSDLYEKRQLRLGYYLQQSMLACLVLEQQKVIQVDGVSSILDDYLILTVFNVGVTNLNFGSQWLDKNMKDFICAPTWSLARFTFPSH